MILPLLFLNNTNIGSRPLFLFPIMEVEQLTEMSMMMNLQTLQRKKIVIMKYQKTLITRRNAMKVIHVRTRKT